MAPPVPKYPNCPQARPQAQDAASSAYDELVNEIKGLYPGGLDDFTAHDAARNLTGFYNTLLAIKREQQSNDRHASHRVSS